MKPLAEHPQSPEIQIGPGSGNGVPDGGEWAEGPGSRATLGLWDAVSIIVGIVVGAGIYQTAPDILANTDSPLTAVLAWTAGGVLSLIGALCYAELAST